jgi:zeaxanthin glucosyltransferase
MSFFPSHQPFSGRLKAERGGLANLLVLALNPVFVSGVAEDCSGGWHEFRSLQPAVQRVYRPVALPVCRRGQSEKSEGTSDHRQVHHRRSCTPFWFRRPEPSHPSFQKSFRLTSQEFAESQKATDCGLRVERFPSRRYARRDPALPSTSMADESLIGKEIGNPPLRLRLRHLRQETANFENRGVYHLVVKIAFLSPPVTGHLNPMTTLAREFQSRNHNVVFISLPDAEAAVSAAGLTFLPCAVNEFPAGSLNQRLRERSKLQGEEALRVILQNAAARTEAMLNSLPATLTAAAVDAVVLDTVLFYTELVPMSLGMPYVHVANALHFDYSGHTPLCCYDWPHETTPAALARNQKGMERFLKMLAPTIAIGRAYAKRVGLDVDWDNPLATISKLAWITQTPGAFDFESSHWPPQFHHTGPFHDGAGRIEVDFPWQRLTGERLIYASMGTLQNGLENVFRAIAEAVTPHEDVQLVLSIGNHLDPEQIGPLPSNTILVKRAPQLELLKRASVCITHAGLNTALEALAQGVPLIAIPVTADQPGVAARIAEKKTGLVVPLKELTGPRLSLLLDQVLNDSTYQDNARYFQKAIAETNGLSQAADLLERAFGLTRKPIYETATDV